MLIFVKKNVGTPYALTIVKSIYIHTHQVFLMPDSLFTKVKITKTKACN